MAVAHKVLIPIYQMLRDRVPYQELGGDLLRSNQSRKNRSVEARKPVTARTPFF